MRNLIAAVIAICIAQGAMAQKPAPIGVMVVEPVFDHLAKNYQKWAAWTDPNVKGILLRVNWSDVQQSNGSLPGSISWKYFEDVLAWNQSNSYGKWFVLSVDGAQCPAFIQSTIPIWTNSKGDTCPVPWDTSLENYWSILISSLGAEFDSNPSIHGVTMWAGGTAIECYFCRDEADDDRLDAIAGATKGTGWMFWERMSKILIYDYMSAFPTTTCYLATGQDYYGPNEFPSMGDLATWFYNLRPGLNGLQSNGENQNYPAYNGSYVPFPHTSLNCTSFSIIMYQLAAPVAQLGASVASVLQNGGPPEDNGSGQSSNGNAEAIQLYPDDPAKDTGPGVLTEQNIIDFNQDQGLQ